MRAILLNFIRNLIFNESLIQKSDEILVHDLNFLQYLAILPEQRQRTEDRCQNILFSFVYL